jgi:hypothetical protein
MDVLIPLAIAIVVATILGCVLTKLIEDLGPKSPKAPLGFDENLWKDNIVKRDTGSSIGLLERIVIVIAFCINQYEIVGFWFTFKLAAKWEVWKNIVRVPELMDKVSPQEWFAARSQLGGYIYTRFLMGTLANLLIGYVAVEIGKYVSSIIVSSLV